MLHTIIAAAAAASPRLSDSFSANVTARCSSMGGMFNRSYIHNVDRDSHARRVDYFDNALNFSSGTPYQSILYRFNESRRYLIYWDGAGSPKPWCMHTQLWNDTFEGPIDVDPEAARAEGPHGQEWRWKESIGGGPGGGTCWDNFVLALRPGVSPALPLRYHTHEACDGVVDDEQQQWVSVGPPDRRALRVPSLCNQSVSIDRVPHAGRQQRVAASAPLRVG